MTVVPADDKMHDRYLRFSFAVGVALVLIATIVAAGWVFDIAWFKSVRPGLSTMKPNTALSFALIGIGLLAICRYDTGRARGLATGCAAIAGTIGLTTLVEYIFGLQLWIDAALMPRDAVPTGIRPLGRMSPITATAVTLLGVSLGARALKLPWWVAESAAYGTIFIGATALMGYAYDVHGLYNFGLYSAIAVHTSVTFIVAGAGLLAARSREGVMSILASSAEGGTMARWMLTWIIAVPPVVGWLRLQGQHLGWYDTGFGLGLMVTAWIIGMGVMVLIAARSLNRTGEQRRTAMEKLAASERDLRRFAEMQRDILDALPASVALLDRNATIVQVNAMWHQRVRGAGLSEEKYGVGANYLGTWTESGVVDNSTSTAIRTGLQRVLSGEIPLFRYEFQYRAAKAVHWTEIFVAPIRHAGERGVVTMFFDIGERKGLEDQFHHAQRMETVGRLAGGIAHDFNNLLTAIMAFGALAETKLAAGLCANEDLEGIQSAADSAANLTRQLLAFSRKQVLAPRALDLGELVTDSVKLLRRLISENIEIVTMTPPGVWPVMADAGQIEQVLMNLMLNARDAMPDGGKLLVETANITLDDEYATAQPGAKSGDHVMLAVSDTGAGMTEDVRARLFEPFFTTKERGKGTGLGLATVFGIIKQHGGHISVYSEPGRGTTFKVYLARTGVRAAPAAPTKMTPQRTGRETVLLVEDDRLVRESATKLLEFLGYRVLVATSGEQALKVSDDFEGAIDLLLTDVVLPKMSGKDVADELTAQRPSLRVLYASGYTENAIVHQGVLDPGIHFLQKPYTMAALSQKVREALESVPLTHTA